MVTIKEKPELKENLSIRNNAVRQEQKINTSVFNYCFITYHYLLKEIKNKAHHAKGTLIDVGCGNSPYEKYFSKRVERYLKHEHPNATKEDINYDFLSELPKLDIPNNYAETIISFSVLEHVADPIKTFDEFYRVLKKEGVFFIYVPLYWHLHEEPYDYFRFTKHILDKKIKDSGFEIIYLKEIGKSFALVGQVFCNALVLLFELEHVKNIFSFIQGVKVKNITKSFLYVIYKSPLILLSITLIPLINIIFLILDQLLGSPRDTIGYFVIAKKK